MKEHRGLTGGKTSFKYNGSSLVDYIICQKNTFETFEFLSVNPLLPHISDHCQISYSIKTGRISTSYENSNNEETSEHKRLLSNIYKVTGEHGKNTAAINLRLLRTLVSGDSVTS